MYRPRPTHFTREAARTRMSWTSLESKHVDGVVLVLEWDWNGACAFAGTCIIQLRTTAFFYRWYLTPDSVPGARPRRKSALEWITSRDRNTTRWGVVVRAAGRGHRFSKTLECIESCTRTYACHRTGPKAHGEGHRDLKRSVGLRESGGACDRRETTRAEVLRACSRQAVDQRLCDIEFCNCCWATSPMGSRR